MQTWSARSAQPTAETGAGAAAGSTRDVSAIARGGLANLVGALVSAVANFLLVIVIARNVDSDSAGVFFGVTSLFLILEALLHLGSDVGAVYFIARWRALREEHRIGTGLTVAFAPVVGACLVAMVAMLVLAPQIADLVGDADHSSVGLIRLLALMLPIASTYDVALGATRGLGTMRPTVLVEKIMRPVLQVVLVAVAIAIGWHGGIGPGWGLPYVVAATLGFLALRAALRAVMPLTVTRGAELRRSAREYWRFALPRAIAGVAQIVLQRLDIVLVAALRGATEAAIYTAATRFLVVGQFISQAIAAPVQPRLAAAMAGHDYPRARELYRVSTCWIVLISWPVFATVAVFGPVYLKLFGGDYRSGLSVVIVLACSMLVASAVGVVDAVVIMAGRTAWNLSTTLGALAVNVVLDIVLIPHIGIVGAAVGWCAAIVAANLVPLALVWRGLGLHPFGPPVYAACALTAVCFGVLPLLGLIISTAGAAGGLAVGILAFAAGAWRRRGFFELTAFVRSRRRSATGGDGVTVVGYIGGLGRSGSTLLERIVGRLDSVCVLGEVVHLWERGIGYDELCSCGQPFSQCPFWREVGAVAFGGWEKVDVSRMRELAAAVDRTRHIPAAASAGADSRRRGRMREYADAFAAVYDAAAAVSGASTVIDSSKHPSTAYLLRRVPGLDLRVVHLVRDSRGVAYSWTKEVARPEATADSAQAQMYRYPPWRAALLWDTHNLAFAGLARLGVPVWRLHYETLLAQPVGTVERLADFLGVGGQDVTTFVSADRVTVGPAHQIAGNHMRFHSGELELRRDEAWRTALAPGSRRVVTTLTAPLMFGYGYFGEAPRTPRSAKVRR